MTKKKTPEEQWDAIMVLAGSCQGFQALEEIRGTDELEKLRAAYIKLTRLVVDWYTAPEDTGFSEETLALQNEAKRLSETPESSWLL